MIARMQLGLALAVLAIGCVGGGGIGTSDSPARVVALAPSIVEMLYELDFGDRVVGVGDYARWPVEVESLPRLGGLFDPRLETIASLRPELAILLPSEEKLALQLRQLDIEVMTVANESLEDIEAMAVKISERLGDPERGERFLGRWRASMRAQPRKGSLRVLLPVARQKGRVADIVVAGPGTFLDELLTLAGATNSMAGSPMPYPQVGLEEIVSRQPEVIVELQPSPGLYTDLVEDWRDLAGAGVFESTCVRVIAGDHVLIPGPRVPRLYRELRTALDSCTGSK
ncbi:MAG: helical backbone metal receptor [Acidobacteriota bacterium]